MYQKDTMDSVVSALGGESAVAQLVCAYRTAIEYTAPHLLADRFDDLRLADSRHYLVRDCVQNVFCEQMKLHGFDTGISARGGSWWQSCIANGNGLSVTTCKIKSAGSKLPDNQFVNKLRLTNQMALPFAYDGESANVNEPIKVVLAYFTNDYGGKTILGGVEIVLPAARSEDEMRMNVSYLGDTTLVQPVHVDGPVVRVKQRRRVVNGDA